MILQIADYKLSSVGDEILAAFKSLRGTFASVYHVIALEDRSYRYVLPVLENFGGDNLVVVPSSPESLPKKLRMSRFCKFGDLGT